MQDPAGGGMKAPSNVEAIWRKPMCRRGMQVAVARLSATPVGIAATRRRWCRERFLNLRFRAVLRHASAKPKLKHVLLSALHPQSCPAISPGRNRLHGVERLLAEFRVRLQRGSPAFAGRKAALRWVVS